MTSTELETYLHSSIPLSRMMEIRVVANEEGSTILTAPLASNHNHLGTAFGGSLATLATLAGYCALWTALGNKNAHVVIRRCQIEYLHPVRENITATCHVPKSGLGESFPNRFLKHGKSRMSLNVTISENGKDCVRFCGEFVAIA